MIRGAQAPRRCYGPTGHFAPPSAACAVAVGSPLKNCASCAAEPDAEAAAQAAAEQQYQSALVTNRSAEQAFANQQEATAAQLKETRASSAQEKLAKTIQGLQARGSIRASEQAGLTVNLLLADAERQTANAREAINQSIESASRQYTRNIRGLESQRDDRRNQLQSNINQAYNQIPSLASVILNTATQGLSSYAQLTA